MSDRTELEAKRWGASMALTTVAVAVLSATTWPSFNGSFEARVGLTVVCLVAAVVGLAGVALNLHAGGASRGGRVAMGALCAFIVLCVWAIGHPGAAPALPGFVVLCAAVYAARRWAATPSLDPPPASFPRATLSADWDDGPAAVKVARPAADSAPSDGGGSAALEPPANVDVCGQSRDERCSHCGRPGGDGPCACGRAGCTECIVCCCGSDLCGRCREPAERSSECVCGRLSCATCLEAGPCHTPALRSRVREAARIVGGGPVFAQHVCGSRDRQHCCLTTKCGPADCAWCASIEGRAVLPDGPPLRSARISKDSPIPPAMAASLSHVCGSTSSSHLCMYSSCGTTVCPACEPPGDLPTGTHACGSTEGRHVCNSTTCGMAEPDSCATCDAHEAPTRIGAADGFAASLCPHCGVLEERPRMEACGCGLMVCLRCWGRPCERPVRPHPFAAAGRRDRRLAQRVHRLEQRLGVGARTSAPDRSPLDHDEGRRPAAWPGFSRRDMRDLGRVDGALRLAVIALRNADADDSERYDGAVSRCQEAGALLADVAGGPIETQFAHGPPAREAVAVAGCALASAGAAMELNPADPDTHAVVVDAVAELYRAARRLDEIAGNAAARDV